MAQSSFALLTNLGRAKEAAALANGTTIQITQIAIGDGLTVPSGGETALYNEVARKTISGSGTVAGATNVAYFDAFLAANDGPFTIREAGLIDSTGALIAIARYDPPINKPVPSSGQTVEGVVRLEVAFSNVANITISIDPTMQVALQRLTLLPWVPIISMTTTAPPASPAVGDTYLVPTGATGSWAGQAGKVAEYTQAGWALITPKNGHGIGLPDGRVFIRRDGVYIELFDPIFRARNHQADIPVNGYLATPPNSPAEGDRYLVGPNPTGAWVGADRTIAVYVGTAWRFIVPVAGLQVQYFSGRQIVLRYDGGNWAEDLATTESAARVELTTNAEARTGTDAERAVTAQALWHAKRARDLATAGGTVNALTLTLAPAPTDYANGMALDVLIATTNTGAATINVNGLGAKAIRATENGQVLAGGELVAGERVRLVYNGTYFVAQNPLATTTNTGLVELATSAETQLGTDDKRAVTPAGLKSTRSSLRASTSVVFMNPGTTNWVVPADVFFIDIECWAAGSGGGGATNSNSGGAGGGAGGYARSTRVPVTPGQVIPVTVGGAGGGGAAGGGAGFGGGASSVGAILSATSGGAGAGGNGVIAQTSSVGGDAAGGNELNLGGRGGGIGYVTSSGIIGGAGGASFSSSPTQANIGAGNLGAYPGGGGSGGSQGNNPGGAGAHGLVIIRY